MNPEVKQHPLISFLEKHKEDRAMLAELRRGLGKKPGEAPGMFPYVARFVGERNEDVLYLIASLFALHPMSSQYGNMGNHLRTLATNLGDDNATERRFVQLLQQNGDALDVPLRQHITLLKSKDIPVNWHQLMTDIIRWDNPNRYVQRNWANAYWKLEQSNNEN
jgi:CRISPR system Cascade subunit CasB